MLFSIFINARPRLDATLYTYVATKTPAERSCPISKKRKMPINLLNPERRRGGAGGVGWDGNLVNGDHIPLCDATS